MKPSNENAPACRRGQYRERQVASYVATGENTTEMFILAGAADTRLHSSLLDLLGAVAADPVGLVPITQAAGIDGGTFAAYHDLLILWAALEFAAEHSAGLLLPAARFLLRREGWWDHRARWFEEGPSWSDERLAALANSCPACPAHVAQLVREAIDLRRRIDLADEYLKAARTALKGRAA